jgi:hypothetical protein
MQRLTLTTILVALIVLSAVPTRATDNYGYGKDEYAIIRDGLAPDKSKSLAAHGDGDLGNDKFHVWLMAEPAHRRIAALIGPENILDTGPGAYYAFWSADSRHVAVTYRSDRHVVELSLYRIISRRAHLISGPSLFRDVTSRDVDEQDDMRSSVPEFEWKGARRFLLRERRLFITTDTAFAGKLGAYGKVEKRDDGRLSVEFSAEADCVLSSGDRYRIVDLRVGKFGE